MENKEVWEVIHLPQKSLAVIMLSIYWRSQVREMYKNFVTVLEKVEIMNVLGVSGVRYSHRYRK